MAKYTIVISQDAMVYEDVEYLKTLPNFSKVWDRCARVDRVRSIYPTLTYPCHTSMMTGVYPDRHGIINNEQTRLFELKSPWVHFRESVKVPTIFDCAKAAGLTTASVFWPVMGNDPSIDYLINEYWPQSPEETIEECFRNSGTSEEVMQKAVLPNMGLIHPTVRKHPEVDRFMHACACDIIRHFKPNLLLLHPANVDHYRHVTGLFTERVRQGLYEIDLWFGEILRACQEAGIYEDTNFFIISDHGQLNVVRNVAINAVLAEAGLVTLDEEGNVKDYIAAGKSTGLSCQVYLKDPDNKADYDKTYATLRKMADDGIYGFSRVYTKKEVEQEEHLSGDFSFILETDDYTSFSNDWHRPFMRKPSNTSYRLGTATHGHHPDKGPQPTLIAFGPDLVPGAVLDKASIIDEPVTIAHTMGLHMENTDGVILHELLR